MIIIKIADENSALITGAEKDMFGQDGGKKVSLYACEFVGPDDGDVMMCKMPRAAQ